MRQKIELDCDTIYKLYMEDNWSTKELAKYFIVSEPTILRRLKMMGIQKQSRGRPEREISKTLIDRIISLYVNEKKNIKKISMEVDVSPPIISKILKEYNVELRKNIGRKSKDLDVEEIERLKNDEYLTDSEIAEKMDCSVHTVRKYMRENKIQVEKPLMWDFLRDIKAKGGFKQFKNKE